MKKIFLCLVALTLSFSFVACSAAGGAMKDDFDYGMAGEAEAILPGANGDGDMDYQYDEVIENGFISTSEKANSTFSLDRNTASYSLMRKIIMGGSKIPQGSVRIEEYVNYFNYNYQKPEQDQPLAINGGLYSCPWNSENYTFMVNVTAPEIAFEEQKQNNIVFLIDTSGSMFGEDRLGLIQQSFTMLTENLADTDIVSIVTYANGTRVAAEGMLGSEKTQIANVLQDLTAGGSTNGSGGIQLAYQTAEKYFIEGGNNRVILATDGDFNVGISNKNQLNEFISEKRDSGIWLSVLGVGMYNTNDVTMKTLAENGNGNYAYLDSVAEAKKVLVSEMGGTLVTVAKDVKINVTFNVDAVEEYRLIGYETKMLTDEDFENEQKDAGEIGSGHTVTAVYELKLKQEPSGNIASAEIRFKDPETDQSNSITKEFEMGLVEENEDFAFICCVVEFGLLLRNSEYKNDASFENVIERLETLECVKGENADQFKAEFLEIVKKAKTLYIA